MGVSIMVRAAGFIFADCPESTVEMTAKATINGRSENFPEIAHSAQFGGPLALPRARALDPKTRWVDRAPGVALGHRRGYR
ncbi:hypothetical protein [Amycolatopsis sacchari]|uniref:hypothetical protein n=1 Tax=Amycolatopsis sacchari TaxID=115433 RepID=UPI003D723EC1